MLEVGKRIALRQFKNPLRMRVLSVDHAMWAWLEEINDMAGVKCQPELAERVMALATELVDNRGTCDDNEYKDVVEMCKANECSMWLA